LSLVSLAVFFALEDEVPTAAPPPAAPAVQRASAERSDDDALETAAPAARLPPAAPPPRGRVREDRSQRTQERLKRAKELGALGVELMDPCRQRQGDLCVRSALAPFFESLDRLRDGEARGHTTIAVLGNSLIAADHIVDVLRERLVERFGPGGRGFLLADRMAAYGPRTRTGKASGRWTTHNFAMGERGPYPFGVAGVLHVSGAAGARTAWRVEDDERARLLWLDHPQAAPFTVRVDEGAVVSVSPSRELSPRTLDISLAPGARELLLEAQGPNTVVYGLLLERKTPGVVVSSFGVPSADAGHFLAADRDLFREQVRVQDPALMVFLLGGNETKRLHWGRRSRDEVADTFDALLKESRVVAPDASCLAIGPIDSVYGGPDKLWQTRSHLSWVIAMQREKAEENGCAFFDLFAAMGGSGSLRRFASSGLLHEDMVHPKRVGLDMLGELLAEALLRRFEESGVAP
jgi:lysophospholipase L1-like esterase